jgi:hypothetical protein
MYKHQHANKENLTCLGRSPWLKQPWQYIGMQRQYCSPLLQMSQSKEYSHLKYTSPLLSSQKPVCIEDY